MKALIAYRLSLIAKELSLCLLSAFLLILSFPNFNFWLLAWLGFVPLFSATQNKSKAKAFLLAYITGIIFWTGIIYWLIHVTLIGQILLILYLALYFGIFGLVFNYELRVTSYELLFFPSIWVLLEYIRSQLFTGFPWALLGNSQYLNLPIIQIADITGVYGVSFLVMMVNVLIYKIIGKKNKILIVLPLLLLILTLGYGYYHLNLPPTTYHLPPIKIAVIQGNIPQELKWDPQVRDFIIDKYLSLTMQATKEEPDLFIWPEAAIPCVLEEAPVFYEKVKEFAKRIKTPLVLGAVTAKDDNYYNSALFLSSEGKLLNRYDKLHLVPFGEYIPLKKILPFLETIVPIGDITAGKEYTVFTNNEIHFSVLICFEDLFPELSREFVKKGAQFLVNITNDAWYKHSSAAQQHFQASVFRAVENRVYLVRSANTGVSGFIDPCGKIISLVQDKLGRNIFVDGYGTKELFLSKRNLTFYTRYGDIFILLLLIFSLYSIFRLIQRK